MAYPQATEREVELFRDHGWIVVEDAIDSGDLETRAARCGEILANKETLAEARFRQWASGFAGQLLGQRGEGDHYPWKVYVNQFTGERSVPESR